MTKHAQTLIPFDKAVTILRRSFPGRVRVITYEGIKQAVMSGDDEAWVQFADMISTQAAIHSHGTPEQKTRLQRIIASNYTEEN